MDTSEHLLDSPADVLASCNLENLLSLLGDEEYTDQKGNFELSEAEEISGEKVENGTPVIIRVHSLLEWVMSCGDFKH